MSQFKLSAPDLRGPGAGRSLAMRRARRESFGVRFEMLLAFAAVTNPGGSIAAQPPQSEIVVSGQLREQSANDVPISIGVVTGRELARYKAEDLEDVARLLPGFSVQDQSPNDPGFVIRGITSDTGASFDEPRVAIFENGVSISRSRGAYIELFDIDRVEVARGPQSTLFGRAALIGAVNIVENKADPNRTLFSAQIDRGNYGAETLTGTFNVPLGEETAFRVSGRYRLRDGTVQNLADGRDFNAVDTAAVRASLHAGKGAAGFDLIANFEHDRPSATSFKSIAYRPTDPASGEVLGDTGRTTGAALMASPGFDAGKRLGIVRTIGGVTGLATIELGHGLTLHTATAYRHFGADEIFDADGLSLPILTGAEDAKSDQISQDARLNYESGRLKAVIGASYARERASQQTLAGFDERLLLARLANALNGGAPSIPSTDPAPLAQLTSPAFSSVLLQGLAASTGRTLGSSEALAIANNLRAQEIDASTNSSRIHSSDVFGDLIYRLGSDFELGAGARYSFEAKSTGFVATVPQGRSILGGVLAALGQPSSVGDALLTALASPAAVATPPSSAFPLPLFGLSLQPTAPDSGIQSQSLRSGGFAWRGTARYAPAPNTSLYASYSRGRRPEVLASAAPEMPFGVPRFEKLPSEKVDSYEIGGKAFLTRPMLQLDVALFRYDYRDFQSTALLGTQIVTVNRGRARDYGIEGSLRWVHGTWLTLFANYAYNHARFRDGVRAGNHLRLSPDHMAAFGANLVGDFAGGKLALSPSVTYQSRIFFDDDNDRPDLQQPPNTLIADDVQDETQKGYALANGSLSYEPANQKWRIEAFVRNLFNRKYIIDAGNTGDAIGLPTFVAGRPRFYGLGLTVRFAADRVR